MRHTGRCHCGNLTVTFESAQDPAQTPLRACQCSFCRIHGVTAVTDPAGRVELRASKPELVSRYQFGLRASEFFICRQCGVYVAAIATIDGARYASLNANVLEDRAAFAQAPQAVDYGRENAVERMARRRRGWTPATVRS